MCVYAYAMLFFSPNIVLNIKFSKLSYQVSFGQDFFLLLFFLLYNPELLFLSSFLKKASNVIFWLKFN
jgi:hypothetical protein